MRSSAFRWGASAPPHPPRSCARVPRGRYVAARRAGVETLERVVREGCGVIPGAPLLELHADPFSHRRSVFGEAGLEQVVSGFEQVVDVGARILWPDLDSPLPVVGGQTVRVREF